MKTYITFARYIVFLSALLMVSFHPAKAQITIPDPNFAVWLQTNYPAAMTGNILDDQDPSVLAVTTLSIPDINVSDFTGLEAFVNVTTLYIDGNTYSDLNILALTSLNGIFIQWNPFIASLPNLPPSVTYIDVTACSNFQSLNLLPSGLRGLYLTACPKFDQLSLPPAFPTGFEELGLAGVDTLTILPSLPNTLHVLILSNAPVVQSLLSFPPLLYNLTLDECGLTTLPSLPSGLTQLHLYDNELNCLPELPSSLLTLSAAGNPVNCLPNLPTSLTTSDIGFDLCNNLSLLQTVPTSCVGICGGMAQVQFAPADYTYLWSNGDTGILTPADSILWNDSLCAFNQSLTLTPVSGCVSQLDFTILQPAILSITVDSIRNTTCAGLSDGYVSYVATGGSAPYWFSIDGGITGTGLSYFNNLAAGTYTLSVTDVSGCTATAVFVIQAAPPLAVELGPNITACVGATVTLCNNMPGTTVIWSTGDTTQCINVSVQGIYTITVTDSLGCTGTDDILFTIAPLPVASILIDTLPACGICNGVISANASGGTPPYSYLWSTSDMTAQISNLCENTPYTFTITDMYACTDSATITLNCGDVWPGDENHDGVVDNTDILAIGIGFGTTGPSRLSPTINWTPQYCVDWTDTLSGNINYKHIDANGDGIIGDADTTAVIQNFGLTHPLRVTNNAGPNDPVLYFDLSIDTSGTATQLYIPLMLGDSITPATDIYGIAFTVVYDTSLVKADSVSLDFTGCWIPGTSHYLSIAVNDPVNGRLHAAVTRTDQTDTTGYGAIGTMGIVTVDNISARLSGIISDTLVLSLSNVQLIRHTGEVIPVNALTDTLVINDNTVGVKNAEENASINIYPNPAGDFFVIQSDNILKNAQVQIYNELSQLIELPFKTNGHAVIVNTSSLRKGLYIVKVQSEEKLFIGKVMIN